MKNTAISHHGAFAGRYEKYREVNGKPSYKMKERAIWHLSDDNHWMIGKIDNIGNDMGSFYAKDNFGGLCDSKNLWNFFTGDERDKWKIAEKNDIVVHPSK